MHGQIPNVKFRTVLQNDVEDLQALYKECFPVSYPESWFSDLTRNNSLVSLVAVYEEHIIGVLVAKFSCLKDCTSQDRRILDDCFPPLSIVAYIMSLGVTKSWRSRGIASQLLSAFIRYASGSHYLQRTRLSSMSLFHPKEGTPYNLPNTKWNHNAPLQLSPRSETAIQSNPINTYHSLSDLLDMLPPYPPGCCAIYLHVLRTNFHARRFYENRGFYSLHVRHGCYSIDGQLADGCTYVMHMNGGYANRSLVNPPALWSRLLEGVHQPWLPGPISWFVQLVLRFGQALLCRIYPTQSAQTNSQSDCFQPAPNLYLPTSHSPT